MSKDRYADLYPFTRRLETKEDIIGFLDKRIKYILKKKPTVRIGHTAEEAYKGLIENRNFLIMQADVPGKGKFAIVTYSLSALLDVDGKYSGLYFTCHIIRQADDEDIIRSRAEKFKVNPNNL